MILRFCISVLFLFLFSSTDAQIDHYETVVYDTDLWSYKIGNSEPPNDWMQPNFNDGSWAIGNGGFGYGDNDDNTTTLDAKSVYLRKDFLISDLSDIEDLILDADYDDAFIAYLNGTEIARANIGTVGTPAAFNANSFTDHEAQLYQGIDPDRFFLRQKVNLLQEGINTIAIHMINFGNNSSDMTGRFFLSFGMLSSGITYRELPSWFDPVTNNSASNLPLISINTNNQAIIDEPAIVAQMGIIDNGSGNINYLTDAYNDYDGRITIEIRGASSQLFEKNNYRIETQTPEGENNNVSLLGMPEENDWVLHGPYSDKSLMRNAIAMHLGNLTGRYAPRNKFCELHINNEYRGVYLLMEKIKRDKNRLDIAKVTSEDIEGDELTGGYILQIDRDNPTIEGEGWTSENGIYPYFYVLEDPKLENIIPVQRTYIETYIQVFETAMGGNNYLNEYEDFIDIPSFADYFIVNELAKHIDAFKLSFYIHKKKESNGGKLHLGPIWDFNLGFGNFDYACDPSPYSWIYPCTTVPNWVRKTLTIPAVQNRIHCRWKELRETVYQDENILEYIDSLSTELEFAQVRNFEKFDVLGNYVWPNDFVGETYEDEMNFLKNYVSLRLEWMDNNMLGAPQNCTTNTTSITSETTKELHTYPNPASDILHLTLHDQKERKGILRIFDMSGKLMVKQAISSNESMTLDIENWQNGMYIFNVQNGKGSLIDTGSIVKE